MPVTDDVASRMISLPLFDAMTHHEVNQVAQCLKDLIAITEPAKKWRKPSRGPQYIPLVHAEINQPNGELTLE